MTTGKYICFEGGDGTGKSTLASALVEAIKESSSSSQQSQAYHTASVSTSAVGVRFPSDGVVGSVIRTGLMGHHDIELSKKSYLYLFAADGLQEERRIQFHLSRGQHIICDRHPTLSGRVFQPDHHPVEHIEYVYNSAAADGISMPDHLFVIDVPIEVALDRMEKRNKYKDVVFETKDVDHMNEFRERYLRLAERFGGVILDGTKSTEQLVSEVREIAGI